MSEKILKKRKIADEQLPLSFHEIRSVIESGDSVKLKKIIKEGRIDDINMLNYHSYPYLTLLSVACRSGFIDCAEVLLNNGANVNFLDYQNCNPVLKSMLTSGSVDMIQFIIARGLIVDDKTLLNSLLDREIASKTVITEILIGLIKDVNYSPVETYNREQSSFLYYVSVVGNLSAVQALLERGATQLAAALRGASAGGHIELVKLLLHEAKSNKMISKEGMKDALFEACRYYHLAIVRLLFEYDADPEGSTPGYSEAEATPDSWITREAIKHALAVAAYRRDCKAASSGSQLAVMKMLIEQGVDADALNAALCRAVTCDVVEVVELLIDSGADVNVIGSRELYNSRQNPLLIACRDGHPLVVRLLLARGANPNRQGVPSPLLSAINRPAGPIETIQLLLEYGADLYDRRATPPLQAALRRPDVLRLLLERGADPNLPFNDGNTALLEVLERGHTTSLDAFAILLQHEADPNLAKPRTGETPLMLVATSCRVEYVKLLLEYGADVTQTNTTGQTVLDMLGRTRKYSEVVALCTSYLDTNRPGEKHVLK